MSSLFKNSNFTFFFARTLIGSSLTKVTVMTFLRSFSGVKEFKDRLKMVPLKMLHKTNRSLVAQMTSLRKLSKMLFVSSKAVERTPIY